MVDCLPLGTNINQQNGYSLCLTVELICSNLWVSPYSTHQQELFDIISRFYQQGWNFKQISDWLVEHGYKSPRDKTFKENIVWSIYMKKKNSIQRFSRRFDPVITDLRVDVTDYVPQVI